MGIKFINPELKRSEIAEKLTKSTSALQRYRKDINIRSSYRTLQSWNTHTGKAKASNYTEHDLKMTPNDLKMTSTDLKKPSKESGKPNRKNKWKGGNSNDVNSTQGRDLDEQVFSPISGWVYGSYEKRF